MADTLSPLERSERMRGIKYKNTKIELVVRQLLFAEGLRYRLQARDLPGKPDIVFRSRKIAIFVNGCFWHQHEGCKIAHIPKSRASYWHEKLERNARRDVQVRIALQELGWEVITVWECETREVMTLRTRLVALTQGCVEVR